MGPVLDFNHYTVAWIAPLQIEARAAIRMLDKVHEGNFRSDPGDDYQYIGGEINGHHVVVATFRSDSQYGGASAAALAAQLKKCFKRLWFGLLVGVAAGLPDFSCDPPLDIRLGDVLVIMPDSDNTGVVQYDFGKQTLEGFDNRSQQAVTAPIVIATFGRIRSLAEIQGNTFLKNMKRIEDARDEDGTLLFKYPGQDMDHLYETGDEKDTLIQRDPREDKSRTRVWYGKIGSGNTLMKSSRERDQLRDKYKIIGLEMEAAGTMNTIAVGNIRGVCDYADMHKMKEWQGYAAAVAAAYAREVLCIINPSLEPTEQTRRLDTLPFLQNRNLVPRDDMVKQLDKLLPADMETHRAAIWGLGGAGKTQIAIEYAYQRKAKLSCPVFWVHASSEARFTDDYNKIARKAGLSSGLKGVDMLQAVHDWLENQVNWLLVLDNADDIRIFMPESPGSDQNDLSLSHNLLRYIPQTPAGSILWTSRDGNIVGSLVGRDEGVMIGKMGLDDSVKLLRGLHNKSDTIEASIDEKNLLGSDGLGGLPLAITQAKAFMEINEISASAYLRLFKESEFELLENEFSDTYRLGVPNSVMQTWRISIARLAKDSPCAERILKTIAFFDNQGIPFELIRGAAVPESSQNPENLSDASILKAVGRLMQYSFLQRQKQLSEGHPTYEQHRLLHLAMRNTLDSSETQKFSKKALKIVEELFPSGEFETWNLCKQYLPHALKVATLRQADTLDPRFTEFLTCIGRYYYQQGLFQRAEQLCSQALDFSKSFLGENHPETLRAMQGLALAQFNQGHYDKAEPLQVQALELRKALLGERHPDTITAMHNLALTLHGQGYFDKAEPLQVQALELWKAVPGERHPDTITSMDNLALTWQSQGYFDKAEPLQVQALELWKAVLGERHPDTITSMNNLALTWRSQGNFEKAESLQVQVLELWKAVLGERHPDTIKSMNNLARTWHDQGYFEKAESLQVQVLELWKAVLGERHPNTIISMDNLALTWQSQGYFDKAEPLQVQALELWKGVLGERHPDTITSMNNLALTWFKQGHYFKAEKAQTEVVEFCTSALGQSHPRARRAAKDLAIIREKLGRDEEAAALRMKLLSIEEKDVEKNPSSESARPAVDTGSTYNPQASRPDPTHSRPKSTFRIPKLSFRLTKHRLLKNPDKNDTTKGASMVPST